jgi:hypothetical protein
VDLYMHVFFTATRLRRGWKASRPGCLTSNERASGPHWMVDCPRVGLDDMEGREFFTLLRLEHCSFVELVAIRCTD